MFITLPGARVHVPSSLLSQEESCWSALRMGIFAPWYIATFLVSEDGAIQTNTLLIARNDWLATVLTSKKVIQVIQLQRQVFDGTAGGWDSVEIQEAWLSNASKSNLMPDVVVKQMNGEYLHAFELDESQVIHQPTGTNWQKLYQAKDR